MVKWLSNVTMAFQYYKPVDKFNFSNIGETWDSLGWAYIIHFLKKTLKYGFLKSESLLLLSTGQLLLYLNTLLILTFFKTGL